MYSPKSCGYVAWHTWTAVVAETVTLHVTLRYELFLPIYTYMPSSGT